METTKHIKLKTYAHVDRRGVITFSREPDMRGLLPLGSGTGRAFREAISVVARHAYDGKTLLVAGVPEAASDQEALEAVEHFRIEVLKRLTKNSKTVNN